MPCSLLARFVFAAPDLCSASRPSIVQQPDRSWKVDRAPWRRIPLVSRSSQTRYGASGKLCRVEHLKTSEFRLSDLHFAHEHPQKEENKWDTAGSLPFLPV